MKLENFKVGDLDRLIASDPDTGEYLVHRDFFRNEEIFELEMRYIFERNWVFIGHESQVANPNDYLTGWIGRQPIVTMRDKAGQLGAYINSCPHKGARICHLRSGNAKQFSCSYHGWVFDTAGRNILIKDEASGAYAEPFHGLDHGLHKIKFGTYGGLMFGSLSDDVPSLDEHLGDIKPLIDLVVEQGPEGIELVPGYSSYTYNANWKMQLENCVDGYHLTSCHPSFMNIVTRRKAGESQNQQVQSMDITRMMQIKGHGYTFKRGHAIIGGENPAPQERGLYRHYEELVARVGEFKAKWMLNTRNLTIYPNVQFAENASLQMRMIRPVSVDKTEMTIYCVGAKGESDEAREIRIRQYEDFFNTSGLATPDDTIAYEDCQWGMRGLAMEWMQGYQRGMTVCHPGGDDQAKELAILPEYHAAGDMSLQDETVMHGSHRAWMQLVKEGLAADGLL